MASSPHPHPLHVDLAVSVSNFPSRAERNCQAWCQRVCLRVLRGMWGLRKKKNRAFLSCFSYAKEYLSQPSRMFCFQFHVFGKVSSLLLVHTLFLCENRKNQKQQMKIRFLWGDTWKYRKIKRLMLYYHVDIKYYPKIQISPQKEIYKSTLIIYKFIRQNVNSSEIIL